MFRPMRRCEQQLELNECIEILKAEPRGVLSLLGDNGYPYGIPMDHWYCEQDGKLYFHGAKNGHKIDSLQSCDKVSYCVYDKGFRKEGEWALNIRSVIVFGRMHPVADIRQAETICRCLCRKRTDRQPNAWKYPECQCKSWRCGEKGTSFADFGSHEDGK